MIKRTFVLFFCLVQTLAFSLLTEQSNAWYKINSDSGVHSDGAACETETIDESDLCDEIYDIIPIIQAHESEWKENLSDLLRHRHSSYRFITLESVASVYFQFTVNHKVFQKSNYSVSLFKGVLTLPGYYSFLHRLCPF